MRVLALETSGMAGSVAALDELQSVEVELDPARRTAQTLAPAIESILQRVGWEPASVDLIAVTQGPGSFTGLRIGATTAKTLAYATGASVLGVNTLEVIAAQSSASDRRLWVIMNAERDQLFAAAYEWQTGRWTETVPTHIIDQLAWLNGLSAKDCVIGPGLKNLLGKIPPGTEIVAESNWLPRAVTVGREGLRLFVSGQRSDWWSLLPNYYRESAAIEKSRESR